MNQPQLSPREATPVWVKALGAIFTLPILVVLLPSLLVLSVCLLPTLGAYVADRFRDKSLAITVGMLNFCGALPALGQLWSKGQTLAAAGEVLGDVFLWLLAYGAAGIGWILFTMMPPVVTTYLSLSGTARSQALRERQEKLIEIWGQEVAERDDPEHPVEDEDGEPG
ncbi:hypothetical protein [Algihabitans albus]|uniref:hypothetical protein n=1 Tax=Algihabitans albus TaxID=2164067 RepID=UPI000E5C7EB5|nr:hypothetical protein [Algihabitans albus]